VASAQVVQVQAPARLHLGFLDPGASLGRRFGSLGLTINGLATVIEARHADHDSVSLAPGVPEAEGARALSFLLRTRQALPDSRPVALRLQHLLPEHQGFGSGTQMALAIAHAVACLEDTRAVPRNWRAPRAVVCDPASGLPRSNRAGCCWMAARDATRRPCCAALRSPRTGPCC